jgi:hypothetical protein
MKFIDENLLWNELNLQKKGVVCQEKSPPMMITDKNHA